MSNGYRLTWNRKIIIPVLVISGLIMTMSSVVEPVPKGIDPAAYTTLLSVIAQGESSGNYNAHYSNSSNASLRFTDMSVIEVLKWQQDYVRQGSVSNAVGRYQIVRPTLIMLVGQLQLNTSLRFDEKLQDRLAIALLERRGSVAYIEQKLSREQFAANLSQEWAALPKVLGANPEQSYYAGDGINSSRVSIPIVYEALDKLKAEDQAELRE